MNEHLHQVRTVIVCIVIACAVGAAVGVNKTLAFDEWSDADITRHAVWTSLYLVDFSQTLKIAREPENYHERNPLIGDHPSEGKVAAMFIGGYIAQTALVHVLPAAYRPWAQYVFIGVSGACVINNFSVGLGIGF